MLKTIIGVVALTACVPAIAQSDSRLVRYDDLNLNSPAGVETLERRIQSAARAVCGESSARAATLGEVAKTRACIAEARSAAARQVGALGVDALRGG